MHIEYEATFPDIHKDDVRQRLSSAGANLERAEFLQKRVVFKLPKGHEMSGAWLRVRDEGGIMTMSLKAVDGTQIHNQKELCLVIDNFDTGVTFLESIGCEKKSYQETKRELWTLDGVEITLDEWPFLPPFVEVEGASEDVVRAVSQKIGFDYADALFCAVATLYNKQYGISEEQVNDEMPNITFTMENPFIV